MKAFSLALTGNDEEDEKLLDKVLQSDWSDRTKLDLVMQYRMHKGRLSEEEYLAFREKEHQKSIAMIDADLDRQYCRK